MCLIDIPPRYVILETFHFIHNCIENIQVSEQCDTALVLVKRETGVNPVRTRHRNQGAEADMPLGDREGGGCEDL